MHQRYQKVMCGHTQPTEKEIQGMVDETYRLIDTFRPLTRLQQMINDKLASLDADESLQIKKQAGRNNAIYNWRAQGRIPYHYVDVLVQIPEVAKAGFTRESLRPDVKSWHIK
jgi:hypothetical protein